LLNIVDCTNQQNDEGEQQMQFVAVREEILKDLTLMQGVVERKSTRPILANVLLETDGNGVKVYATDLEVGLSSRFPAEVKSDGSITAPAKKMADIVKLLPAGQKVVIEVVDNYYLKITCGKIEYKIAGASKEDFPSQPRTSDEQMVNISPSCLKTMISQTIYSITTEETRYALNGAQLSFDNEAIRMVTTDAHRLAFSQFPFGEYQGDPKEILIPRKTVAELRTLISDMAATVEFSFSDSHLFFKITEPAEEDGKDPLVRILDSRTIEGQFPSYEKVLPKDNDKEVVINKEAFAAAIGRVALLSHETSRAIRLAFQAGLMIISSSHPEVGEAKEELEVNYDGPELSIGFNAKYLSDFIGTIDGDEVILELKGEAAAGLLRPMESGEGVYKYVIMPMRI
jgi:DNA polymerase-3 subunit beta